MSPSKLRKLQNYALEADGIDLNRNFSTSSELLSFVFDGVSSFFNSTSEQLFGINHLSYRNGR